MELGKKIGRGNTANVYEYGKGKVLKLFNEDYPINAIEREIKLAGLLWDMDFAKPRAYEIVSVQGRSGIIYDKLEGESLLDWVMKNADVKGCAVYMADLHKKLMSNNISNVPNYKEFLRSYLAKVQNLNEKEKVLTILDRLPNGNTLCHGDFHPGNIFISNGHTTVLDFMNVCHGPSLYDIARTIFLVEYTPIPVGTKDKGQLLKFKKTLADLYLMEMEVTKDMIKDYLKVIIAARKGECPDEILMTSSQYIQIDWILRFNYLY